MKKSIIFILFSLVLIPNAIFAETVIPSAIPGSSYTTAPSAASTFGTTASPTPTVGPTTLAAAAAWDSDPDNIAGSNFSFDINSLSPGGIKYDKGATQNIGDVLKTIAKLLLMVIPTLAVLFMVFGAIKIILAGGDSTKINNGKAIIIYNITAVVIALLSWSIIKLIIWTIGSAV